VTEPSIDMVAEPIGSLAPRRVREVPSDLARKLIDGSDKFGASFDTLRMDDIAKASGIPRATLYYHFAGKDDVLAFLHDTMLAEHRASVSVDDAGSARDRLTTLLARHFAHIARHPGASQLLVVHLGRLRGLSELAAGSYDPLAEWISRILEDGIARGEVRRLDVERTTIALSTSAHIAAIRSVVSNDLDDADEQAAWLVDLIWEGVGVSARP
jgi:AcrR family transcriptional regulator